MPLTADMKKKLRGIGHVLEPVVTVAGNGLHEALLAEAERAIRDHELIKVRFAVDDRDARRAMERELCRHLGAELVQQIGKLILIYRRNPDPNPRLSNLRRHADR